MHFRALSSIPLFFDLIVITLIMVYKSHLIRATLDALDFLEIFQEPWLDFLSVKKSHLEFIDGPKNINF